MDGLEATEINLSICKSIIDFRIDANTYKKDYVKTDKILKELESISIEKRMKNIQNFGAYSLCNDIIFTDKGIPFLMTQNIRHNYIDWSNLRYVNEESHKMLYKSHCTKNQVLVTMAGEYLGRVAVYDKEFKCSSNQAIAKITLKNNENPYLVSTFLNTKYGQNQINRFKTITGQPNINMALIKSLVIPPFSVDFANKIQQIIETSNNMLLDANKCYKCAEELLLNELSVDTYEEDESSNVIKNFAETFSKSGRLDAEYYQKKYDDYKTLIEDYNNGYKLLGDICKIKDSNFIPKDKEKYKYIELSNIGMYGEINGCIIDYGENLPTRARRMVAENDVVISSIEGSLSSCALVEKEFNNALCSSGFYVINSNIIESEVLLVLFKLKPMQNLMKKGCSGTILTAINKNEFVNIPLPLIRKEIQKTIVCNIQENALYRKKSKELLERAKKAVEIAVEQGEDEAINYINS
ncbi:restriction endonuclease subunit S [Clostridium sp. C2-6-12]|uniref:restriction endonuclease subunit S n=1 Tax=Clostridium sp. C2-6-12 TaxID=2698832 RepID=UPI001A9BA239|nr:restriction endonuclease subunit S [Clostridium sp. C2-6-12]